MQAVRVLARPVLWLDTNQLPIATNASNSEQRPAWVAPLSYS